MLFFILWSVSLIIRMVDAYGKRDCVVSDRG